MRCAASRTNSTPPFTSSPTSRIAKSSTATCACRSFRLSTRTRSYATHTPSRSACRASALATFWFPTPCPTGSVPSTQCAARAARWALCARRRFCSTSSSAASTSRAMSRPTRRTAKPCMAALRNSATSAWRPKAHSICGFAHSNPMPKRSPTPQRRMSCCSFPATASALRAGCA